MYQQIINPETGRKILINGKKGKEVLKNYLNFLNLSHSGGGVNVKNVYYISYNAIISGSVELRALNKHYVFPLLEHANKNNKSNVTKIGQYAYMYDNPAGGGGKLDEPNYDGLSVSIALLDNETFNNSFIYKKVSLCQTSGNWGNGNFLNEHKNTKKFCMIPEKDKSSPQRVIMKDRSLFSSKNYATDFKHLFILGPLSKQAYDTIIQIMNSATSAKPVIIHYQGESHLAKKNPKTHKITVLPPRLKDTSGKDKGASGAYKRFYGLTPKGGLFANSFNWIGGMKYGIKLRNSLEKCSKCYTVCVRNRVCCVSNEINDKIHELDSRKNLFSEMKLPGVYRDMNDYIFNTVYTQQPMSTPHPFDSKLLTLSDITIVQDLYDKDNSTAIEILAKKSTNKLNLILVGKECGKIMVNKPSPSTPVAPPTEARTINRRVSDLCSGVVDPVSNSKKFCVPPYMKPNDFPTGMFFTLLNFGPNPSSSLEYWPDFKNPLLSHELDKERTKNENIIMTKALLQLLSTKAQKQINYIGNLTTRGHDTIALAGDSEGACFPFNELLFVPGLLYALDVILNKNTYSKKSISDIKNMLPTILSTPTNISVSPTI
tara:strand:+ start:58 stop:1857 length:1800 start_codon:yes stop_codon:yes gene_type:complete